MDLSSRYACDIQIGLESSRVDAKSIMAVMLLAATRGTVLNFEIEGEDAEIAFNELVQLINDRFGEDE